jgi:hypothetical protein
MLVTEKEALTKICPMMSHQTGGFMTTADVKCHGSQCMLFEFRPHPGESHGYCSLGMRRPEPK